MLTFPKSYTHSPDTHNHTPDTGRLWRMFLSSSNHRYNHIQCYVIEPNRNLEYSLTDCSATRQESFLLFTAYNVASVYLTDGQCQLALGSLIPVSPVFSVSQPANVNSTEFRSVAEDSFTTHIGFSTCSGSGVQVSPTALSKITPTASNPSSLTPVASGRDQNSTQSISTGTDHQNPNSTNSVSTHSPGSYDKKVNLATGITIPVTFLGLVLLGFLVHRRRKKQKTLEEDPASQDLGSPLQDPQPYLQQKAELEAEEKRKHELEARERRYEMGNEGERYELPVEEGHLMIRSRQELRGEEHSRELEVPR